VVVVDVASCDCLRAKRGLEFHMRWTMFVLLEEEFVVAMLDAANETLMRVDGDDCTVVEDDGGPLEETSPLAAAVLLI
jgi:hypothetical protein